MGLRCSLLGHDYGETTTEREREEQGNEVVTVERELQECSRCGNEKVVSENTEVRSLEPDQSPQPGAEPDRERGAEPSAGPGASTPDSPSGEAASGRSGMSVDAAPSAGEDDGVILDDAEAAEEDRPRGQWPDDAQQEAMTETADTGEREPAPWPEHEGEDEGFDAEPSSGESAEGEFEFGGGLAPERAEGGDESGASSASEEYVGAPDRSRSGADADADEVSDPGFTTAGPVNPPTGSTDDADTVLVCPECGFEKAAARASLRAGDICPECRRGYLAERR